MNRDENEVNNLMEDLMVILFNEKLLENLKISI